MELLFPKQVREVTQALLTEIGEEYQRSLETFRQVLPEYYYHSTVVGRVCCDVALQLHLPSDEVGDVTLAGYFHDIGKLKIPIAVVNKDDTLSSKEIREMCKHVRESVILAPPIPRVRAIIGSHHEWQIGGYPRSNPKWTVLPEEERHEPPETRKLSQILVACDQVHAIISPRTYKGECTDLTQIADRIGIPFYSELQPYLELVFDRLVKKAINCLPA